MNLQFTAEESAFQAEVQDFLRTSLSADLANKVRLGQTLTRTDMTSWHRTLQARGWLASHWPVAYGGPGWSPVQRFIFEDECALANAPRIVPFGVNMLGPVLIRFGTDAQKAQWLPRILDGSDWWCQGYSEPGAGSDLASLRTTAERSGNHYVVNGQKTWTTYGQYANKIFCLVRTDRTVKKQAGISFLLIDMNEPGVEVRPIRILDGGYEVNEVFLTNVRVPLDHRIGAENEGWTCAKYLLTYERTNLAGVGFSAANLAFLKSLATQVRRGGRPLRDDFLFAARLARVEIELENMKITHLRTLAMAADGGAPDTESSMLKIRGTEIRQEILSLIRRAAGPQARPYLEDFLAAAEGATPLTSAETASAASRYFNHRKLSIFGGSNEIQRNILARMALRL